MEPGYSKADSANLPKVDSWMLANFFALNPDFFSAEFRNVKTAISSRESYGDDAVGYVQLRRDADLCTVQCKICPEHKVRQQPYKVSLVVDEKNAVIQSVQCHDCPASEGGCKHAVAFLMWCHRRSEEPACTSTESYWQKSKLAKIGSTLKCMPVKKMLGKPENVVNPRAEEVFADFVAEAKRRCLEEPQILKHLAEPASTSIINQLSMHHLSVTYNKVNNCEQFLDSIKPLFTEDNLKLVEEDTREQHASPAWYELRYGRVTASKAFDVSRCRTPDGSLVAAIMGAKLPDTPAMKRGRNLEDKVRKEVAKQKGNIKKCGLLLSAKYPMLAASPDGILNNDTIIEIKCPSSAKQYRHYIMEDNQISEKFAAQVQLQMEMAKLKKCLFCVADLNFEETRKIQIIPVDYDEIKVNSLICELISFWKNNIYTLLYDSTQ